MGRDLTLYPNNASKDELRKYVENLGFEKCEHFWNWPEGTLNYSWFEHEDYKSIDGVSADIFPVEEEREEMKGFRGWALHVRNRYSASFHDVKMLNDVLRGARKKFGGTIKGDYGTNRYAPIWEDKSTPLSRGISRIYSSVQYEMRAVIHSLPDSDFEKMPATGSEMDELYEFIKTQDPSRVIYNGLVPFAVSMFEYFFSQVFQILIKYDKGALNKRKTHKQKIDFEVLLEVEQKITTIEEVIARNYTFQNLSQLNRAYKDWLGIDVRKILFKKKKIGRSIKYLENRIAEIIQYRHGIIHHFEIDKSLDKKGYIDILETIGKALDEFKTFIENKYDVEIRDYM